MQPYTARDDLGGVEDASMDLSHAKLNSLLGKLGINVTCQAGPGSARFVQKFLPETMVEPEEADLKIMVVMSALYSEIVSSKPVYTVSLHNKIKKAGGNALEIPQNVCEGADADFALNSQRVTGLIKLAIVNKMKFEFSMALAAAIPKIDSTAETKQSQLEYFRYMQVSTADGIKPVVDSLIAEFSKVNELMLSLPNLFPALYF